MIYTDLNYKISILGNTEGVVSILGGCAEIQRSCYLHCWVDEGSQTPRRSLLCDVY